MNKLSSALVAAILFGCAIGNVFANELIVNMDRTFTGAHDGSLSVIDGPLGPSVLTINGASIAVDSQAPTNVRGSSSLLIQNGELGGTITARDASQVVVHGGNFVRNPDDYVPSSVIVGADEATIRLRDGVVALDFDASIQAFEEATVVVNDSSRLIVDGGEVRSFWTAVEARDNSTLDLNSGAIRGDETRGISGHDSATINLNGGIVEADVPVVALDDSTVFFNGGQTSSTEEEDSLALFDRAQSKIVAGTHGLIGAVDQSHFHLTAGSILRLNLQRGATADISGGQIQDGISAGKTSAVNVWGGQVYSDDRQALRVFGVANIWGGNIDGSHDGHLLVRDGEVHIRGGSYTNSDAHDPDILASGDSTIHVYGSRLSIDDATISGILTDDNAFSLTYDLRDAARIELHELTNIPCDLDSNGTCDLDDIDLLVQAIEAESYVTRFDLESDGQLDQFDQIAWLEQAATRNGLERPYEFGDANLDGVVDGVDLNVVGLNWQSRRRSWSDGNFLHAGREVDFGKVDARDLNALANSWGGTLVRAVPEPTVHAIVIPFFLFFLRRQRFPICRNAS